MSPVYAGAAGGIFVRESIAHHAMSYLTSGSMYE